MDRSLYKYSLFLVMYKAYDSFHIASKLPHPFNSFLTEICLGIRFYSLVRFLPELILNPSVVYPLNAGRDQARQKYLNFRYRYISMPES